MLFYRLSLALSVFQPWNSSALYIASTSTRLTRQCCLYLRGLNSVNKARVHRWKGRQSFCTSASLRMNQLEKIKNGNVIRVTSSTPLQQERGNSTRADSQAVDSTVSVGGIGMAPDMDMSSLGWESQFVALQFERISSWEDITLLLRKHVDPVIKFVESGFCQIAVQQEGFSLGVGGKDSLATNSVMLPIRGGSLLLGTGQRVILHHLSRREEDAPVQNDDLDGNRVAPLQLSLTWCGMKMEVQKKHAFIAPRVRDDRSDEREAALRQSLSLLGVDANELVDGGAFEGTSAYRCYQSFVCPRPSKLSAVDAEPLGKAAERVAMQVSFLLRKQRAEEAEYLRNTDVTLAEYERLGLKPFNIVLVLDNVRSAYNVGSIFRTADTTRTREVITTGLTPQVHGPGGNKIRKTAFNSVDSVCTRHVENSLEAVFALETTDKAKNLFDLDLKADDKVALVVGNEVMGVEVSVMDVCDEVVEIPVYGLKNSLNVCSAATVAVYEVLRQMTRHGPPSLQVTTFSSCTNMIQEHFDSDNNKSRLKNSATMELVESYSKQMSEPEPKILESIREVTAKNHPQAAPMICNDVLSGLLKLITRAIGARRVLEFGTFVGYSSLCFVNGGASTIVTCESDAHAAEEAERNIVQAGAADKVEIRVGPALETMKELHAEGYEPFDLVFIDADKRRYVEYYDFLMGTNLLARHGVIIADNVLFKGMVPLIAASIVKDNSNSNFLQSEDERSSHTIDMTGDDDSSSTDDLKIMKRRRRLARALHEFNLHAKEDHRSEVLILPVGDGISIITRSERH